MPASCQVFCIARHATYGARGCPYPPRTRPCGPLFLARALLGAEGCLWALEQFLCGPYGGAMLAQSCCPLLPRSAGVWCRPSVLGLDSQKLGLALRVPTECLCRHATDSCIPSLLPHSWQKGPCARVECFSAECGFEPYRALCHSRSSAPGSPPPPVGPAHWSLWWLVWQGVGKPLSL